MRFKLVVELFNERNRGHSGSVAEGTESASEHVLGQIADERDVAAAALAVVKTLQKFAEPGGAFAAGDAPSAAFVGVKAHDAKRRLHDAGIFVHDDNAARAQHRFDLGHG